MTQEIVKIKRTKRLPDVRVTQDELSAVKTKAQECGLAFSEYARRALLSGVVVVRNERQDAELLRALSAIGNNMNQIARSVNVHGGLDDLRHEQLGTVLPALEDVIDRLVHGSEYQ